MYVKVENFRLIKTCSTPHGGPATHTPKSVSELKSENLI